MALSGGVGERMWRVRSRLRLVGSCQGKAVRTTLFRLHHAGRNLARAVHVHLCARLHVLLAFLEESNPDARMPCVSHDGNVGAVVAVRVEIALCHLAGGLLDRD